MGSCDEQRTSQINGAFSDSDVIVNARLERVEMQMLDKLVEGLGHLGIVTTTKQSARRSYDPNDEVLLARLKEGNREYAV